MDKILDTIKSNKKILIIVGAVLVLLLGLKVYSGTRVKAEPGVATYLNEIHSLQASTGEIKMKIGEKDITVNTTKKGDVFNIALTSPVESNSLLYKSGNKYSLDYSFIDPKGGILSFSTKAQSTDKKAEPVPDLIKCIIADISAENGITLNTDGDRYTAATVGTEDWSKFCGAIKTTISENKELIATDSAVKAELSTIERLFETWSNTSTIANTFNMSIGKEATDDAVVYSGNFEITLNFDILPEYIDQDAFDSNQLKIVGTYTINNTEGNVAQPTGVNYSANVNNLGTYAEKVWLTIFDSMAYVPLNEVSVSNNKVVNSYELGSIKEVDTYDFTKEGITSVVYTITVPDEELAKAYEYKYGGDVNFISEEQADGTFVIKIEARDDAIASLNKIGTTPEDIGNYLKSSKGGDIIA